MYSTYYSEEKVKYAKIWKYIIQYIHIFYELLQGSALLHCTGSDSDEACPLVICQRERMEQGMPQVCIMNLMGRGLKWRLEKVKVEELSRPSESWLNQRGLRASLWRDATSEVETC